MAKEFVADFPLKEGLINSAQASFDQPKFRTAQNVMVGAEAIYPFHPKIALSEPCQVWQDGRYLWRVTAEKVLVQNIATKATVFTCPSRGGRWFFLTWGDGMFLVSTTGQAILYTRNPTTFDDTTYTVPAAVYWTVYNGQLFYVQDKMLKCSKIGKIDFTIDATNEAGAVMLPSVGMAVESIGTRLFVFCSDGLYTVSVGTQVLGLEYYKPLILQHSYALAADTRRLVFVTHTGKLNSIWYNGESQELGYDNILQGKRVTITYVPAILAYVIQGEIEQTHLLNEFGLTSTTHKIYGAYYDLLSGDVWCVGEEGSREVILESQVWIFSQTSLKLLRAWELHADIMHSDKMSVGFILHYTNGQVFSMPRFSLRHSTTVTPSGTANRVQYCLYGTSDAFTKLEMVKLRWQRADFSQIRGADASGIAG